MIRQASKLIGIVMILLLFGATQVLAAETPPPGADDITVSNHLAGMPDSISVDGLLQGDVVKVYSSLKTAVPIGVAIAGEDSSATVYIHQLGMKAGSVYLTVTSGSLSESARIEVPYGAEAQTAAVLPEDVTIDNNNAGYPDVVRLSNRTAGEVLRVYSSFTSTNPLAETVSGGTTAVIFVSQIGQAAGSAYVSAQKPNEAESVRTAVSFGAETFSAAPSASQVTVVNEYNTSDTITVTGITPGDTVIVYDSIKGTVPLGSADADAEGNAEITLSSGLLSPAGGKIFIAVKTGGANESSRTPVTYAPEITASAPSATQIIVFNNYNAADTVTVTGLSAGDIVTVYASLKGEVPLATATANAEGTAAISLDDGLFSPNGGKIYVTVKTADANESARTPVSYPKEAWSEVPKPSQVSVVNNYNDSDIITVTGLSAGDTVTVYASSSGTEVLGSAVADAEGTAEVTLSDGILSPKGGRIFITVKGSEANESKRASINYPKETTTSAPTLSQITVANYYNTSDTITVTGLMPGDTAAVYASTRSTEPLGSAAANAEGTAEITLNNGILSPNGGKIYVSVKTSDANESDRTAASYTSEKSTGLKADMILVDNRYYTETDGVQDAGTEDIVRFTSGFEAGDIINIYQKASGGGTWIEPYTVTDIDAEADSVSFLIGQLGTDAGRIYVTITKPNKTESARISVPFDSEPVTAPLSSSNVIVANNYESEDIITVLNVTPGQTVTVYTSPRGQTAIANEVATGDTVMLMLNEGLLAAKGGKIYVSVKDETKLESSRTPVSYASEVTAKPVANNILVVNYPGVWNDTVTIIGLSAGDTVTVYDAPTGGAVLAKETVMGKGTTLTLITNLPDSAGTIYVSVTSVNKAESPRIAVKYHAA